MCAHVHRTEALALRLVGGSVVSLVLVVDWLMVAAERRLLFEAVALVGAVVLLSLRFVVESALLVVEERRARLEAAVLVDAVALLVAKTSSKCLTISRRALRSSIRYSDSLHSPHEELRRTSSISRTQPLSE